MKLTNTSQRYGMVAIILHWIMALIIIILYLVGDYMVDLQYFDPLYYLLPDWHKSFGLTLLFLLLLRLFWKVVNPKVKPLRSHKKWEVGLAKIIHIGFYLLIFITCISGYLISTSKGASVFIFDWIEVPSIVALESDEAELVGLVHERASTMVMILFVIHLLGALKHQFIDKDGTMKRMTFKK